MLDPFFFDGLCCWGKSAGRPCGKPAVRWNKNWRGGWQTCHGHSRHTTNPQPLETPKPVELPKIRIWSRHDGKTVWHNLWTRQTFTSYHSQPVSEDTYRTERSEGGEEGLSPKGEGTGEASPSDKPYCEHCGAIRCPDCGMSVADECSC
jgi:hypothetical protein